MSPFEYILPLVSVLVGLAVADLVTSLHRLLRGRSRVQWDWLPLTVALLAILTVLNLWWGLYQAQDDTYYKTLAGFLPLVAQLILLFLVNAAVLPDDVPAKGTNLKNYYEKNSSYIWLLFAAYVFVVVAQNSIARFIAGWDFISILKSSGANLIVISIYCSLVFIRNRLYHAIIVIVLLIVYIIEWSGLSLGSV